MTEWRTRKRGTPRQIGTKFPVRPTGYIPKARITKTLSYAQISDAFKRYLTLMEDPTFRMLDIRHRVDIVADELMNLGPYEKLELLRIAKKFEERLNKPTVEVEQT